MKPPVSSSPRPRHLPHPPEVLAVGCARCWAAGYCAAYSPASPTQPPPACPLLPRPAPGAPQRGQ